MERTAEKIRRCFNQNEYREALFQANKGYQILYAEMTKISTGHKSRRDTIKAKIEMYRKWKNDFSHFENIGMVKILHNIEIYCLENKISFLTVEGSDILKQILVLHRHCKQFADMKL
ncbi:MAG: hypothetical protein WC667_05105 [Sulfurimonas sp.]|jgi:hypothetical protein